MITLAASPGIDAAIDASLARVTSRARTLGSSLVALADALGRATRGGKRLRPALVAACRSVMGRSFAPGVLRSRAESFSRHRFHRRFTYLLERVLPAGAAP